MTFKHLWLVEMTYSIEHMHCCVRSVVDSDLVIVFFFGGYKDLIFSLHHKSLRALTRSTVNVKAEVQSERYVCIDPHRKNEATPSFVLMFSYI